jgi:LTXXQ motif family protein
MAKLNEYTSLMVVAVAFAIALPVGATGAADSPRGEVIVAQAATPAPMKPAKSTTSTTTAKGSHSERVESRISEMHTKLKITPAEEGQWNNVAQAMRRERQDIGYAHSSKDQQREHDDRDRRSQVL